MRIEGASHAARLCFILYEKSELPSHMASRRMEHLILVRTKPVSRTKLPSLATTKKPKRSTTGKQKLCQHLTSQICFPPCLPMAFGCRAAASGRSICRSASHGRRARAPLRYSRRAAATAVDVETRHDASSSSGQTLVYIRLALNNHTSLSTYAVSQKAARPPSQGRFRVPTEAVHFQG